MENEKLYELILNMYQDMRDGFTKVDIRFDRMDARIDSLERRFDGLELEFRGLEARFDGLEARFDGLEATVNKTNLMIETEIKPNIQALFDGYVQHTHQIERLDQKVDVLQTSVNNIEVKVLVNDNKLIDLSRKLASNA